MLHLSKISWLVGILIVFVFVAGFFVYQWWQTKGELAEKIGLNKNLIKQADELQKEIEELKTPAEEIKDETTDLKTYRNEGYKHMNGAYKYEIKYPVSWKVQITHPGLVDFSKKNTFTDTEFSILVNVWGEFGGPFTGCTFIGEEITIKDVKVYPSIFSDFKNEHLNPTDEECKEGALGNSHAVYLEMCFDDSLNYLRPYCEMRGPINYYQFLLDCAGKKWQGREGMEKCEQLFDQIMATFRFIK